MLFRSITSSGNISTTAGTITLPNSQTITGNSGFIGLNGGLTTAHNTLDDGSGGATIIGHAYVGSSQQFVVNSSGLPTKSNNIGLVGEGFPSIQASVERSDGSALGNTTLMALGINGGMYRVSYVLTNHHRFTHKSRKQISCKNIPGFTGSKQIGT